MKTFTALIEGLAQAKSLTSDEAKLHRAAFEKIMPDSDTMNTSRNKGTSHAATAPNKAKPAIEAHLKQHGYEKVNVHANQAKSKSQYEKPAGKGAVHNVYINHPDGDDHVSGVGYHKLPESDSIEVVTSRSRASR